MLWEGSVCPYRKEIDEVMSNFDHTIDHDVEARLKEREVFARYPGWNFNGRVWWCREAGKWKCEVWVYGSPRKVVEADSLEDIMQEVCGDYGNE